MVFWVAGSTNMSARTGLGRRRGIIQGCPRSFNPIQGVFEKIFFLGKGTRPIARIGAKAFYCLGQSTGVAASKPFQAVQRCSKPFQGIFQEKKDCLFFWKAGSGEGR
jgi:hypothetical protein